MSAACCAGVEEVVTGQTDKVGADVRTTGADAVDMESHIAARYAAEHARLPFAAVRVISDPAHRELPKLTIGAIKPNGNVVMWKVMRGDRSQGRPQCDVASGDLGPTGCREALAGRAHLSIQRGVAISRCRANAAGRRYGQLLRCCELGRLGFRCVRFVGPDL